MPDGQFISACWKCKCEVWLPTPLYKAAKHSSRISFFCAYGHEAIFSEGETEADKLRRERDMLKQQMAQKDDEIAAVRQQRDRAREDNNRLAGAALKAKKRSAAGVCQACNRQFQNVARHMHTKHPHFAAQEVA